MGEPDCGHAQLLYSEYIAVKRHTQGTETSKYLKEKKTKVIPSVAASESGLAQTIESNLYGVVGRQCRTELVRRSGLERPGIEGKSPVAESKRKCETYPE